MSILKSLRERRTHYALNKDLPVSQQEIVDIVKEATELVPDAFNMKSTRVAVLFDKEHEKLWDTVYSVFDGKVPREKIDSFKAGAGTVLYFYDEDTIKEMQEKFPLYADNFPVWANQSNGMLQLTVWTALKEKSVGASVQHYNPIIDEKVKALFDILKQYKLIAQMPFGGIENRVIIKK